MSAFRFATLNIWGLPGPLSWPPRRVRFPRVRDFLAKHTFDVVAVQELWRTAGRPRALDNSGLIVPKASEGNSGLGLSSRFPVLSVEHKSYGLGAPFPESLWTDKGMQHVALDVDGTRVDFFNTHVQAYRTGKSVTRRAAHLGALLAAAVQCPGPVVAAGDWNVYAGIASDVAALKRFEDAGFVDAVAPFDSSPTFDMFGERERFDRVYVRGLTSLSAKVHVDARLADHRPVVVELALPVVSAASPLR